MEYFVFFKKVVVYFVSSTVLAVQCFCAFRYGIGRDLAVGFLFLLLVHLSRSRELAWVGTVHYSVINIRRWAAPNLGRPALSARGGPSGSAQPDASFLFLYFRFYNLQIYTPTVRLQDGRPPAGR